MPRRLPCIASKCPWAVGTDVTGIAPGGKTQGATCLPSSATAWSSRSARGFLDDRSLSPHASADSLLSHVRTRPFLRLGRHPSFPHGPPRFLPASYVRERRGPWHLWRKGGGGHMGNPRMGRTNPGGLLRIACARWAVRWRWEFLYGHRGVPTTGTAPASRGQSTSIIHDPEESLGETLLDAGLPPRVEERKTPGGYIGIPAWRCAPQPRRTRTALVPSTPGQAWISTTSARRFCFRIAAFALSISCSADCPLRAYSTPSGRKRC